MKRNKKGGDLEKKHDNGRAKAWIYLYIACLAIIVITRLMPIVADIYIDSVMDDMDDEYSYHLRFPRDGYQSHYYVERWNTSAYGIIDLTYYTDSNTLDVETANIKVLGINSRSLYEDKCERVTGRSPYEDSNLYKKYFIERDLFTVNILTRDNRPIQNLSFTDTPIAYEVRVNSETWNEGEGYYYAPDYSMVIGYVPPGTTHVEIWFQSPGNTGPIAIVDDDVITAEVDEVITFDGSSSHDDQGIEYYYWDFGDGNFSVTTTPTITHSYSKVGVYEVILTVKDADSLMDTAYITVTIVPHSGNYAPTIIGVVPNQEKTEDCEPWVLDLRDYGSDVEDAEGDLKWYLTGEDKSLYTVVGENLTNLLTFIPVPHTSGHDEVILWLKDTNGDTDFQILWVNITTVNDPPYFDPQPPSIYVRYDNPFEDDDDPAPWNYTFYVHDSDTPLEELFITTSEPKVDSGTGFVVEDGLSVTFHYPQSMVGESFFVTLSLSDGYSTTKTVIMVNVTSEWVPELVGKIPDVVLEENTTIYDVFDLDDYFIDRDHDSLFFSSGYRHLNITINEDNTVDITSLNNWIGTEFVTFRATDPVGAIVEDTIIVNIVPVNDAPVILGVPDFVVHYDYPYRFDLSPYISDEDHALSDLTVWTSEPLSNIWTQYRNDLGIVVNYPESMLSMTFPVTLYVSDGIESGSQVILISVTDDHPPELSFNLPDVSFDEDTVLNNAFKLDNYFYDPDGDALYYTNGTKYISAIINDDFTVDFYAPENWYGFEYITIRATDPYGALAEDKILIVVVPVNDPPIIRPIPNQEMRTEPWILDLSNYIEDVDNDLSHITINVESEIGQDHVTQVGNVVVFDYPEGVEYDMITVTANDGDLDSSSSFSVGDPTPAPSTPSLWDMVPWPWLFLVLSFIIAGAFAFHKRRSRYWVYEAFLIHEKGLPIAHGSIRESSELEDVVVSGMFTAVQDFISDALSGKTEDDWEVEEMKFGGNKILIERSESLYLALIFEGNGKALRKHAKKLLKEIDEKYGDVLKDWDGDMSQVKGINTMIEGLITTKLKEWEPGSEYLPAQAELVAEKEDFQDDMMGWGSGEDRGVKDEDILFEEPESVFEPSGPHEIIEGKEPISSPKIRLTEKEKLWKLPLPDEEDKLEPISRNPPSEEKILRELPPLKKPEEYLMDSLESLKSVLDEEVDDKIKPSSKELDKDAPCLEMLFELASKLEVELEQLPETHKSLFTSQKAKKEDRCSSCKRNIKPGMVLIKCKCGSSYHGSCVRKERGCLNCGQVFDERI